MYEVGSTIFNSANNGTWKEYTFGTYMNDKINFMLISVDDGNDSTLNQLITRRYDFVNTHSIQTTYDISISGCTIYCGGGTDTSIRLYFNGDISRGINVKVFVWR